MADAFTQIRSCTAEQHSTESYRELRTSTDALRRRYSDPFAIIWNCACLARIGTHFFFLQWLTKEDRLVHTAAAETAACAVSPYRDTPMEQAKTRRLREREPPILTPLPLFPTTSTSRCVALVSAPCKQTANTIPWLSISANLTGRSPSISPKSFFLVLFCFVSFRSSNC